MNLPVIVKKNKTLVTVLIITVLCSIFLIYECLITYDSVQNSMREIEKDDEAVKNINKKSNPNPVKRSATIIEENTEKLRVEIRTLRRRIGSPYREQLLSFLANLESSAFLRSMPENKKKDSSGRVAVPEMLQPAGAQQGTPLTPSVVPGGDGNEPLLLHFTEDEIFSLFESVYNEYYADRSNPTSTRDNDLLVTERKEIFDRFRTRMAQPGTDMEFDSDDARAAYIRQGLKTFDKAFARFHVDVQSKTLETVDDLDAKFIFMHALGVPRTMPSLQCKYFVDEFQTQIEKNPSLIPGLDLPAAQGKESVPIQQRIPALTYNHNNALPHPANVVHILRHYRIIEDLYSRMRDAKIRLLHSIASPLSPKPSGDLGGDPVKDMGPDFKRFIYEVTITSTCNEIRNFINLLHGAFRENRVYDIQEINLFKMPQADEIKGANETASSWKKSLLDAVRQNQAEEKSRQDSLKNKQDGLAENQPAAEEPAKNTAEEALRPFSESDLNLIFSNSEYGVPIVGNNDLVTAVIKFNYIVYVGGVLGKNQ